MQRTLRITIVSRREGGSVAIGFDLGTSEFEMARACKALGLPKPEILAAAPCRSGLEVDPARLDAASADGDDPQLKALAAYWRQLDRSLGATALASIG